MIRRSMAWTLRLPAALALAVMLAAPALADVNKSFLRGIAIKGYDPVAYFTDGRPVEGSADHTAEWMGATWRFASAANRDAFAADPARYAPQYGGYCAYGVAKGSKVDIDPAAWSVVDGRLYLNYSQDVQKLWQADVPRFVAAADANWPALKGE